jgi:hypothetical protein
MPKFGNGQWLVVSGQWSVVSAGTAAAVAVTRQMTKVSGPLNSSLESLKSKTRSRLVKFFRVVLLFKDSIGGTEETKMATF